MKYIFIAVGCWLLLNLLFVVLVTPPRSRRPRQLARTIHAVKKFMMSRRQPPT
jgi:hypothetical protein